MAKSRSKIGDYVIGKNVQGMIQVSKGNRSTASERLIINGKKETRKQCIDRLIGRLKARENED